MLWLLGCTADLLPDETVVAVDVPADRWDGAAGERFGASIAGGGGVLYAAAPGVQALDVLVAGGGRELQDLPAVWVGLGPAGDDDPVVYVALSDGGVWKDGVQRFSVQGASAFGSGAAGVIVGTGAGWTFDGATADPQARVSVGAHGVVAVALGEDRVLANVCAPDCAVQAWGLDGQARALDLPSGPGGAVAEWAGVAWAGDPEDDVDDGAGRVCSELGECLVGEPGDHLGRAIGGGYAAGTFTKWIVPARARFVPLDGGPVLAMESGAEDQPLAVAGDADTVWLGAPYYAQDGQPGGVVYAVARP